MEKMLFFVIVIFILGVLKELIYNKLFIKKKKINNIYSRKKFMTEYEKYFFDIFKDLEGELDIKIHPQINLASIVNKEILIITI